MRVLHCLLVVVAWCGLAWSPAHAASLSEAELSGHYWLQNVREVGGELLLRPDASFEWKLSYGAVDQYATGKWRLKDGKLELLASRPKGSPLFRLFAEDELRIRKPAEPGSWIAIVGVPQVGPAAGMEVLFESAGGKRWRAVTDRNGDAIVQVDAAERWTRAGLRRDGDQGDWQWFAIPAVRAEARLAAFAIDDISQIAPLPFEQMILLPQQGKLKTEDGGMVYAR
ncbi:hypothetical protein [Aquitalea magnusonii]|uniref:hypothetical protein n=1 Tax=Aquitalea magnusonii TaxID=332411 RepID=UPI0011AE2C4E|nr:hypothetical protein [Aquitalea magnusonii]